MTRNLLMEFKSFNPQADLSKIQSQIDEFYGLFPEEIAIVEGKGRNEWNVLVIADGK